MTPYRPSDFPLGQAFVASGDTYRVVGYDIVGEHLTVLAARDRDGRMLRFAAAAAARFLAGAGSDEV